MSEYQYFEFRAVDRPLTEKQMAELRRVSTRAEISPDRFVNVYNYGDFRGDPMKLVEKYFDAFLYLTNWGSRCFMLRAPDRLLDSGVAAEYGAGSSLSSHHTGNQVIVSFTAEEVEEDEWEDGEGWLASLVQVRTALMRGDHRALYLGWLLAVQADEVDDDTPEPAVPTGLGRLDAPLKHLAQFLHLDSDLITAAAEQSKARPRPSALKKKVAARVSKLPASERNSLLASLIAADDPHLAAELQQQMLGRADHGGAMPVAPRRCAADLLERARVLRETHRAKEEEERTLRNARRERAAIERRRALLESQMGSEDSLWNTVHRLIDTRQPKRYDEAVNLLRDLRDMAEMQNDATPFMARMADLHAKHVRKSSLVDRFRKANLAG